MRLFERPDVVVVINGLASIFQSFDMSICVVSFNTFQYILECVSIYICGIYCVMCCPGRDRRIGPLDEGYILRLFERPDVTVVIKGLANSLDPHLWSTRYLAERCGEIM